MLLARLELDAELIELMVCTDADETEEMIELDTVEELAALDVTEAEVELAPEDDEKFVMDDKLDSDEELPPVLDGASCEQEGTRFTRITVKAKYLTTFRRIGIGTSFYKYR